MRGKYLFRNNEFVKADQWDESSLQGLVVYEVLRIIEGVPLFFDDHYQRLLKSCELSGKTVIIDKNSLFQQFIELGRKNGITEGNIMLKFIFTKEGYSRLIYFIPHSYPTEDDYRKGVKVGFLETERVNPEAKVEQGVKEKVNQSGQGSNVYEVMLIDSEGYVTEGSRSNLVFVKGDALYTCPLNRVLKGITLSKVLEIASIENIPVVFEAVHLSVIDEFDALFITGTSPKVLPVAKAGITFDTENQLIRKLIERYNELVKQEINNAKNS